MATIKSNVLKRTDTADVYTDAGGGNGKIIF